MLEPLGPDASREASSRLYDEARKLGLLADDEIQALFSLLLRDFDQDYFRIVKERVEKAKRAYFLSPRPMQRYLPTKAEARGEIVLGTTIGQGYEYGISPNERHHLLLGSTGYGKSYITRTILKAQLQAGKHCVIFSKKRDARSLATRFPDRVVLFRLADRDFKYNPKQGSPGISLIQANTDMCESFCQAMALLLGSSSYIQTALAELDAKLGTDKDRSRQASFFELHEWITRKRPRGSREAQFQDSTLNRLEGLLSALGPVFACSQGFPIEQALNDGYSLIFEIDGIKEEAALFLTTSITLRLFTWMLHSDTTKPEGLTVSLDDAAELFNVNMERQWMEGLPIMSLMAARFRVAGLIIASIQTPRLTSTMLRQNCATKIMVNHDDYEEALSSSRSIGLPDAHAGELTRLRVGEAICFKPSYPYPVKVAVTVDPEIEE